MGLDPVSLGIGGSLLAKKHLTPKLPDIPNPAKRPEREEGVNPEDIQLGGVDEDIDSKKSGKRSLLKPKGTVTPTASGLNI